MKTLVVLVGPQGSGKTTYCEKSLKGYLRISQDDQGKDHLKLFDEAIQRGEPFIVVDRINFDRHQRGRYLGSAHKAGYHRKIVWLNVEKDVCLDRIRKRGKHPTLKVEDADAAINMYFSKFQAPSKREAEELEVVGQPPTYVQVVDVREKIGKANYAVVGDIHGCLDEFLEVLDAMDFDFENDWLVSVGDVVDRGPKIKETVEWVMKYPRFLMVCGNHEDKFLRWCRGTVKKVAHGLQQTIDAFGGKIPPEIQEFFRHRPLILRVPDGYVVHGGFDPLVSPEEQNKADCIFMRYYGGDNYFDSVAGTMWYKLWPKDALRVFFGHDPDQSGPCYHNVYHLDGGCVFGGYLKAWSSKDKIVYYAQAREKYSQSEFEAATSNPHEEVRKREEYVQGGLLRGDRTDDGELAVYTYTDQVTFERSWDRWTINSRGHVFNVKTGECVAWAMPKFHNLGEREGWRQEDLPWEKPYEVYEKVDGWLGTLYRHEGKFKVASRGSFHSEGAQWATKFIQSKDLGCIPNEATLCFEIIDPQYKIILDYKGMSTLIVLCAFNRETREEYPRSVVEEWANKIGLPVVKKYNNLTLEKMLAIQKEGRGMEGFVVRMADGKRVKVKTEWYMTLAKLYARITPIGIWECMKNGKVQESFKVQIAEEIRPLADKYINQLEGQYEQVMGKIVTDCGEMVRKFGKDKKTLALNREHLRGTPSYSAIFPYIAHDQKKLEKIIMDSIYPSGNNLVSDV